MTSTTTRTGSPLPLCTFIRPAASSDTTEALAMRSSAAAQFSAEVGDPAASPGMIRRCPGPETPATVTL